jgi:GTP-binding protein
MLPVIALVGRPNVGKSTLFNVLTHSKDALVADRPGLTRDRQYGQGYHGKRKYIVVDTGGLSAQHEDLLTGLMAQQSEQAILEADIVFFLVSAREGVLPDDYVIAKHLRKLNKKIILIVNKIDGVKQLPAVLDEFFQLGLGEAVPIAASHGRGVTPLLENVLPLHVPIDDSPFTPENNITFAIIGRPNVGKSTLVNRMLGEERVVVYDMPGTTRDSVSIPFERHGKAYTIIDTAGVRRRGRIDDAIEKFSVIKTLQAIAAAQVVVMVFDAQEGITDQDLHLLGFVLETGKSLVIALNKWDGLSDEQRERVKVQL